MDDQNTGRTIRQTGGWIVVLLEGQKGSSIDRLIDDGWEVGMMNGQLVSWLDGRLDGQMEE